MKVRVEFSPRDWCVGVAWYGERRKLYLCLLPMLSLVLSFVRKPSKRSHELSITVDCDVSGALAALDKLMAAVRSSGFTPNEFASLCMDAERDERKARARASELGDHQDTHTPATEEMAPVTNHDGIGGGGYAQDITPVPVYDRRYTVASDPTCPNCHQPSGKFHSPLCAAVAGLPPPAPWKAEAGVVLRQPDPRAIEALRAALGDERPAATCGTRPCPSCQGWGSILVPGSPGWKECRSCAGKGRLPAQEPDATVLMTPAAPIVDPGASQAPR